MDKDQKFAVVTGANRGIGLEFAAQLLDRDEGWSVVATCRKPEAAPGLAALRKRYGGRLILPLGNPFHFQHLTLVTRKGEDYTVKQITGVLFVPMTGRALEGQ